MTDITKGHSSSLEYILEGTKGSEPSSGTLQIPSDVVTNVSISPINNAERLYSIDDHKAETIITGMKECALTFEYKLQQVNTTGEHVLADSIEYAATTRSSGQPSSYTFYYTTASGCTYMFTGAMCGSLTKNVNDSDKTITVRAEFWAESCATSTAHYTSLTPASALNNTYEKFTGASVQRGGATIGKGVSNFTATINNNLQRIPVIGSSNAYEIVAGELDVSGQMNVLVEDGGATQFGYMDVGTAANITLDTGATASQSLDFTYTDAVFTNFPFEQAATTPYVAVNCNWIAENVTLAAHS